MFISDIFRRWLNIDLSNLENIIRELGGEVIDLDVPVKTVSQAAEAVKVSPKNIIKSLICIVEEGEPVLVIVTGDSKVDLDKLSRLFGSVRLASPNEVKEITGFEVGGIPPVGLDIKTVVDRKVLENDYVYGGGGCIMRLSKLDPRKIVEYQGAEILNISR